MPEAANPESLQHAMDNALKAISSIGSRDGRGSPYTGRQDIDQKEEVVHGHHRAMIDIRLKPLIYQLWRAGYETLGSCEEWLPGSAYIEFLSRDWGGDALVKAGRQLGIE